MRKIFLSLSLCIIFLNIFSNIYTQTLVGSWTFNDGTANDFSGGGNHGVVNGATLTTDRFGNQNSAYIFDGVDDYISLTGCENFSSQKGTIAYWIKAEKYPNGIFNFYSTAPGEHHTEDYIRSYINLNGKLDLIVEDENIARLHVKYDMGRLANGWLNEWLHIAWTQDGNGVKLYINGEEKTLEHITASNSAWWSDHLQITNADLGQCWGYFDGAIDDFQIYNYALSATEIQGLYNTPDPNQASKGGSSLSVEITPGNGNYIIEKTYHTETTETSTHTGNKSVSINYFDGLGRASQRIQVAASPDGKDMIQHIAYDELGREAKKYLPYTSTTAGGFYRDDAATELDDFYKTSFNSPTKSVAPWSDIVYEESPLNRILEQGAPGSDFQAKGDQADHAVHFAYQTNETDEVKLFELNTGDSLVVNAYYNTSTLYKTGTRDENGVWSYEYKNILGQVMMKESDPGGLKLRTYYVYDIYGLLRYVIPPKAVELITQTTGTVDTNIISNLCYYYEYDSRKRMVMKQLPGAGPVYLVYDKRDRLVLTQDGNLRTGNKWMFTKYDVLNRPVMTGIYDHGTNISRDSMQTIIDTVSVFYETFDVTQEHAYQVNSYPNTNLEILTVMYYDTYDFDQDGYYTFMTNINTNDFLLSEINEQVKGQITGTKTRILGTDQFITNITLYDDKYRPIRSYSINPLLLKSDLILTKYNFIGNILKTWQIHEKNYDGTNHFNDTIHIRQRFEYDHALRLTHEYHKVSSNPEILLVDNQYNELGQLIQKNLHETTTGTYLQSLDYEYNIRGWLTRINNPDNLQETGQAKDLFAMELAYNNPTFGLNTEAQFNGNISAIRWTDDHYNEMSAYVFAYDHVNRLNIADHQKYVTNWDNTQSEFDLDTVAYDANGNIMKLRRYRDGNTLMDDMEYAYYHGNTSNQLHTVTDYGEMDQGFLDYNNTVDYTYDANGNLTKDYNKGIDTITFNYLNLPQDIIGGTDTISYFYTADGTKIAKLNKDRVEKLYLGNVVYDENALDYIITSEGMVKVANENTFTYEYYLKDHLGNTRVAFDESRGVASLTQVNHYYPFGMNIGAYSYSFATDNKYKYNGKELQDDVINGTMLNLYDYGARFYDPAKPGFMTLDPRAEDYHFQSPYIYAANNPILYVDVNGEWPGVTLTYLEIDASAGFAYNGAYIRQSGVARDEVGKSHFIMRANMTGNPNKDGSFVLGAEASITPEVRQSWAASTFMGLMKKDIGNVSLEGSLVGSVSVGLDSEKGFTVGLGLGLGAKFSVSFTEVEESISLTYDEADNVNDQASGNKSWGLYNISEEANNDGLFEAYVTVDVGDDQVKTQQKVYSKDKKQWMSTNYRIEAEKAEKED